jgi:hypothetical protein
VLLKRTAKPVLNKGGLKASNGTPWTNCCLFYGWKVVTDATLIVKHLKPEQIIIKPLVTNKVKLYTLGYGFIITAIASAKLSFMKRSPYCFSTIYKVLKAKSATPY